MSGHVRLPSSASGWAGAALTVRALLIGTVGLTLGGCATSEFSMHSLPPDTPAAVNASAVRAAEAMEAAAKQAADGKKSTPAAQAAEATAAGPQGGGQPPAAQTNADAPTASSATGGVSEGALPAQTGQVAPGSTANAGVGATNAGEGGEANKPDTEPLVPLTPEDAPSMYTYDPWERLNRFTYRFNSRFDEAIFLPATNGYRRVPGIIRLGVHNFFSNLSEVDSVANYILQARFLGSAKSLGRFVLNTTVGIGGLFDVAKHVNLPGAPTGFSETMSTWGVHPGPYLVVPILGPSTLRDGVGYLGDYGLNYGVNLFDLYRGYQSYALGTLNAIDTRSNVGFRYYATGSPFEYEVIRFLYVRKRLIEDDALHGRGKPKPRDADAPAGR